MSARDGDYSEVQQQPEKYLYSSHRRGDGDVLQMRVPEASPGQERPGDRMHFLAMLAAKEGGRADARCPPTPYIVRLLWPTEVARVESDEAPGKRRKVCGGCRTSAQCKLGMERVRPANGEAAADDESATHPVGEPDATGMALLSVAASTQARLAVPALCKHSSSLDEAPPIVPSASGGQYSDKGETTGAPICGGLAVRVPPVKPRDDSIRARLSRAGLSVSPDARH